MKTADRFNRRIEELIDTYNGGVPMGRCILEATRMQASMPDLRVYRDDSGEVMLEIIFADSSRVTLLVHEEM